MQLVQAIVNPFKLEAVRDALQQLGVAGITVTEVRGFGRQKGHTELYRGAQYVVELLPKISLEIVVQEASVAAVVEAIRESASDGKIGDGKIFVMPVQDAVRIRTGEQGEAAL
jgi:nitrogen regulatory protein PII